MSDAPSFLPDHDFVELLWENGPTVMQGQSNRQKKSSYPTPTPSHNLRVQEKDGRDPMIQKFGQFGTIDSTVKELSSAVPCANIGLNTQDDDMSPWMNYATEDPLCSEFFYELAGINPNPRPSERNSYVAKDFHNVENGNASKALREGSEPSKIKSNHLYQSSFVNNNQPMLMESSTHQGQSQKQDLVSNHKPLHTSGGFGLMNFSHFSRPASLARANIESLDRLKAKETVSLTTASTNHMESTLIQCSQALHKVGMRSIEKTKGDAEAICHEDALRNNNRSYNVVANNNCAPSDQKINNQISSLPTTVAVVRNETEKGPEPIVASSSVCSGNSAGAASNDPKHQDKRKNREGEESGYHSEDLDDESTGLKNHTPPRGGTGTKRSRAAEVHNLSERRRRDRINEKMRALQELIPNCNKVDKASMLDEAIEYLKTLQLQIQMMSMGSGLCMSPMMLPPGMQHMRGPPMAHFPAMNVGMGMGMGLGYGMGMLDMNGIPIPSMHTPRFPCPQIPGSTGFQLFGIPGYMHGQGIPMSLPCAPLFNPLSNLTPNGNLMNEASGTIANTLPASGEGPSSRCMNMEAKQHVSNRESQAQLEQMGNHHVPHGNNGNATANTIGDTGHRSRR